MCREKAKIKDLDVKPSTATLDAEAPSLGEAEGNTRHSLWKAEWYHLGKVDSPNLHPHSFGPEYINPG